MVRLVRFGLVLASTVTLVLAAGFFLQVPLVTNLWPLPSGRLSNIFIASILAAVGAPMLWIGLSGELRAMAGGAINLMVTNIGFVISLLTFYSQSRQLPLLIFAILSVLTILVLIGLLIYSHRFTFIDAGRIPMPVRISFGIFAAGLLAVGGSLVMRRPNIFPWPVSGENSVLYGWIFLGAMCYFLYALAVPRWGNARGQLIGFLAYDLVLIAPFIAHFASVQPQMLTSLIVYTAVVFYSGLLAIYFLFIHPETRFRARRKDALQAV